MSVLYSLPYPLGLAVRGWASSRQKGYERHGFFLVGSGFCGTRLQLAKSRSRATHKDVCLVTKAAHLEAISDLSTGAFLAAFRRFVARLGRCAKIWSDNGTNFRGADAKLKTMFRKASAFYKEAGKHFANQGTS